MSRARAAQLVGPGRFDVRAVDLPELHDEQVLVRMTGSSICGSDLHVVHGDFLPDPLPASPGYPGHEGIGIVELSSSEQFSPGEAVLTVPHIAHMTCFAEFHLAEAAHLLRLPDGSDPWRLLMAQQLGTVLYATQSFVGASPGCGTAVIIGAGSAGYFFAQLLHSRGFDRLIVSEPAEGRREATTEVGADIAVNPDETSLVDAVHDLTAGRGAELVIDAAGTTQARQTAVECAADRGTVGLFGYPSKPGLELFPLAESWRKMLTLVASANTQLEPGLRSFRTAIELLSAGQVAVGALLSGGRWRLDDINAAFDHAYGQPNEKIVLEF